MGLDGNPLEQGIVSTANYVWDTGSLTWVRAGGSTGVGSEVEVTNFPDVLTDAQLRATPVPVSGPLTDTELRASPVNVTQTVYTTRLDEASSTVTYIGKAAAGATENAGSWQIQKMEVSGAVTTVKFADGDTSFNNNWTNRASLSYS